MNYAEMLRMMTVLGLIFDAGFKVISEHTKNMTPAELDAFIADREKSAADIEASLDAKYGTP